MYILDKLMKAEGIFLKKVDRRMYRKLKAMAAQSGVPVYKILNDAIAAYVRSAQSALPDGGILSQEQVGNIAYEVLEADGSLQGRWAGIADGKVLGTADTVEEAVTLMRERYSKAPFKHGIVARLGGDHGEHEWLAGSLQRA
jgi:hypothetical protein